MKLVNALKYLMCPSKHMFTHPHCHSHPRDRGLHAFAPRLQIQWMHREHRSSQRHIDHSSTLPCNLDCQSDSHRDSPGILGECMAGQESGGLGMNTPSLVNRCGKCITDSTQRIRKDHSFAIAENLASRHSSLHSSQSLDVHDLF